MATEQFTQISLGVVFTPLNVSHGIVVKGNVAALQSYDLGTGQWTPNYAVSFLVLEPWLVVKDPDGVIPDGPAAIANGKWTAIEDGTEKQVSSGTDYAIDGTDMSLSVKRNLPAGNSLLLRFEGEYLDPRTGELYPYSDMIPVRCDVTETPPVLTIDQPSFIPYNPVFLADNEHDMVIKARFRIGQTPVDPANYILVWEKRDEGDTDYAPIDGTDIMDYDVEVSADGSKLTVHRDKMGNYIDVRVRAKYDPYGNPSSVVLDDRSPAAGTRVEREMPKPEPSVLAIRRYRPGQTATQPECRVYVGDKEVADPEKWWLINWYLSTNNAQGTVTNGTSLGTGVSPVIPLSKLSQTYGATGRIGLKEKGPLAAAEINGQPLTLNGVVLLIPQS